MPSLTVGGFSSKVGKSDGESKTTQKQKSMEKKQARRTGRKPKTDPADYKYNFRLNAQEKSRFEKLFLESGARDRTIFIKKSIFSEQLKVIKVDKVSMDYYIRLGEFYRQFQAIGNNYNQVVRAVQKNFGEKRAMSLLYKLEKATLELILLNKQIMALTKEYEKKGAFHLFETPLSFLSILFFLIMLGKLGFPVDFTVQYHFRHECFQKTEAIPSKLYGTSENREKCDRQTSIFHQRFKK